jgi:hypothetical protein
MQKQGYELENRESPTTDIILVLDLQFIWTGGSSASCDMNLKSGVQI